MKNNTFEKNGFNTTLSMDLKKPDFEKLTLENKKLPEEKNKQSDTPNTSNETNKLQLASEAMGGFGKAMGHFAEASRLEKIERYIDEYYKENGSYLSKEHQEIFDTILSKNGFKKWDIESKKNIERMLAFDLINSPETKDILENFNLSIDTSEIDLCKWGVNNPKQIFKHAQERYLKYKEIEHKKICEAAKINVNESYKKNGTYLEKEHKDILDTVLSVNKIKLTEDERTRIERQLAVNLLINPEYKKTFETTDFTVTKNNNNPNTSVIRNIDDVFSSAQQRLPDWYTAQFPRPNYFFPIPGKYKEDFIKQLRCSVYSNAWNSIENDFKLEEQERRDCIRLKKENQFLEEELKLLEEEFKLLEEENRLRLEEESRLRKEYLINSGIETIKKLTTNVLINIIHSPALQEQKENVIDWLKLKIKSTYNGIFDKPNKPVFEFPDIKVTTDIDLSKVKNLSDHIRLIIQINDFLAQKNNVNKLGIEMQSNLFREREEGEEFYDATNMEEPEEIDLRERVL